MNAIRLCLLAGCILLIPGPALSQESGPVKLSDEAARQFQTQIKVSDELTRQLLEGVRLTDPTRKQMYEDIEILRRILNEKLNLPRDFVDPLIHSRNLNQPQGGGLLGVSGGGSGMGGLGGGGILGNPGMQGGMPGMGGLGALGVGG